MATFYMIIAAGLFGVVGHFLTRHVQNRTDSTFVQYILSDKASTMQSITANLASSFAIYSTVPDDLHGKALLMVVIGAYMAGYTMDSKFNHDSGTPTIKPIKEIKNEDINDIIDSDRKL